MFIKSCVVCGEEFKARGKTKTCRAICSLKLKQARRKSAQARFRQRHAERIRKENHQRYIENREAWLAESRARYIRNKERYAERARKYATDNRDKTLQRQREWYRANKPRLAKKAAFYRAANAEKIKECKRYYRSINLEQLREKKKNYTAERTAACRLLRDMIQSGIMGAAFMTPLSGASKPDGRVRVRPRRPADKVAESNRKSAAQRNAALRLVRELRSNGLEALL